MTEGAPDRGLIDAPGGIFALDLASLTGWAIGRPAAKPMLPIEMRPGNYPPQPMSGVRRIGTPACAVGIFLSDFEDWFIDMCEKHGPKGIIFASPIMRSRNGQSATSVQTARKLYGLAGEVEKNAMRMGTTWIKEPHEATVKKHFCGSGKGGKEGVLAECARRGWVVRDDNHADALAMWDYAGALLRSERAGRVVA